jgi:hypothetical protein
MHRLERSDQIARGHRLREVSTRSLTASTLNQVRMKVPGIDDAPARPWTGDQLPNLLVVGLRLRTAKYMTNGEGLAETIRLTRAG